MAHRAVDAVAGPRQVEHVHSGEGQQQQPGAQAPPQAAGAGAQGGSGDCIHIQQEMNQCFEKNSHDVAVCQDYVNMFKECQQQQQEFR